MPRREKSNPRTVLAGLVPAIHGSITSAAGYREDVDGRVEPRRYRVVVVDALNPVIFPG
jgi:hypothetical protein